MLKEVSTTFVKGDKKISSYLKPLEVVSRLPVPKVHCTVVGSGNKNTVSVDSLKV